jgi:hypothetical protein
MTSTLFHHQATTIEWVSLGESLISGSDRVGTGQRQAPKKHAGHGTAVISLVEQCDQMVCEKIA